MKKHYFLYFICCFAFGTIFSQQGNVGINTANPLQKLHIAGPESTFRVEMLDSINNLSNRSDRNAPLYVDHEGVLTLEFDLLYNDIDADVIDAGSSTSSIFQEGVENVDQLLFSKTVTVARPSYLEIKFSISFQVYLNENTDIITDQIARAIRNYFLLNGSTARKYGMTSKAYINSHLNGVSTTYYNNASTYIFLNAGTHTISFYGSVGSGSLTNSTYVTFGIAEDQLLMRLY
jgi:hypothetical protein